MSKDGIAGLFALLAIAFSGTPLWAVGESKCLLRCVVDHPKFEYPECSEREVFLEGPSCYEVYNDCLQACDMTEAPERFIPPPSQVADVWRQRTVCDDTIPQVPFETLAGDQRIDPRWSGQCECYNGRYFVAECGHEPASCNEVCQGNARF